MWPNPRNLVGWKTPIILEFTVQWVDEYVPPSDQEEGPHAANNPQSRQLYTDADSILYTVVSMADIFFINIMSTIYLSSVTFWLWYQDIKVYLEMLKVVFN